MNSELTTGLLAARVRVWKRVMNRLIPFHSQPAESRASIFVPRASLASASSSLTALCHIPSFLTMRCIDGYAVIENWLPQTTLHFVSSIRKRSH